MRPSTLPSAKTIASDGPAGRPTSTTSASSRLAATTHGLPGPTIFATFAHRLGAVGGGGDRLRAADLVDASDADERRRDQHAASTVPSGAGGVKIAISGTPATTAGTAVIIVTDGNEPLPRGT